MNDIIRVPSSLLNFEKCQQNLCVVDNTERRVNPEKADSIKHGYAFEQGDTFRSPLYELGKHLENKRSFGELRFFGDEKKLDLRWFWNNYEYLRTPYTQSSIGGLFRPNSCRIISFENEVEELFMPKDYAGLSNGSFYGKYYFHLNNYYENITIIGANKEEDNHYIYRAPRENIKPVDGSLLELTLAPREMGKKLWCSPVTINAHAVAACVERVLIKCFDTEKHEGCRLYLIGENIDKESLEKLKRQEKCPYSIVLWENGDFVINKLKQAGWNN